MFFLWRHFVSNTFCWIIVPYFDGQRLRKSPFRKENSLPDSWIAHKVSREKQILSKSGSQSRKRSEKALTDVQQRRPNLWKLEIFLRLNLNKSYIFKVEVCWKTQPWGQDKSQNERLATKKVTEMCRCTWYCKFGRFVSHHEPVNSHSRELSP